MISLRTNVQAGKHADGNAQVGEDRGSLTPVDQSDVLRDITLSESGPGDLEP
ncbi:hypothetical protein SAMN05216276_103526 [Streptosporangium subroseum]|uniref:Uncharacterized protein n=1 Tax=Streptosporangium subroseum TaxID=106412 RepID=A0A239LTU3_9ACTN|nr:hypothetical protein SAMN05216276_103526 [Streptosporangium subroseum]